MKLAGYRVRVDRELRDEFVSACRARDISAAQVLRSYMRSFVEQNQGTPQGDFFEQNSISTNLEE